MRALILKLKQVTNQMKRVHKDTVIQGSLEVSCVVDTRFLSHNNKYSKN